MNAEEFNKLSQKEQRIAIAKDVIAHIECGSLSARQGSYIYWRDDAAIFDDQLEIDSCQLNEILADKHCSTCAKGAMFYSHLMKTNHMTVKEFRDTLITRNTNIVQRLDMFTQAQLDLIEMAFEKSNLRQIADIGLCDKAYAFGDRYFSINDRLRAIMQNIVDNDGTFVL